MLLIWGIFFAVCGCGIIKFSEGNSTREKRGFETTSVPYHLEDFPTELEDVLESKGKRYYLSATHELNWFGAMEFCNRHSLDLVGLDTEADHEAITNVIFRLFHRLDDKDEHWFWTSGNSFITDRYYWVWMSSGQLLNIQHWAKGEPKERCLCLSYKPGKNPSLSWYGKQCNKGAHLAYAICQDRVSSGAVSTTETIAIIFIIELFLMSKIL